MRKVLVAVTFLTMSISLIGTNSFAENYIYDDANIKLKNLVVRSTGIEFTVLKIVKKKKINITPLTPCVNTFFVSPVTAEYNTIAAFLLAAKTSNKKIGIEYDADYDGIDCLVPVISVGIP